MRQKKKVDKDSRLYRLRHSLAHVMAQAVLEVYPDAKLGFGPPVDNGFYYDFDFGDKKISETDFEEFENRMRRIIKEKHKFEQFEKPLPEAIKLLEKSNQNYKVEYAKELVETGKANGENIGFYRSDSFLDMCEGPHCEHTGEIPKKCFKLDKISGSYWRGDEKLPMLTRIYGLAFNDAKELKNYIKQRELAMQRDHKKLGTELDLFFFDNDIGVGLPMWLPKGTVLRDELEKWAKEEEFRAGYQRVTSPVITKAKLYYCSGHLPYYAESMFPPMEFEDEKKSGTGEQEKEQYYLRPMNCPHHHKTFAARPRSYRDLPLRLSEYGNTFRYEKHGSLSGLLRVRAMCMNDAHIYCEYDQVKEEFKSVMEMYTRYYKHLRIGEFRVRLSLHSKDKDKFIGDEDEWIRSEEIVRDVLNEMSIEYDEEEGEAAFYGPKVDIQLCNLLGREETVSTCQLDFVMADRFELEYTAKDGSAKRPYVIHRAPLSTHERMISFLIEYYGGAFPTWMAPVQVCILPVNDDVLDYAKEIKQNLTSDLFRVEIDDSSATFNKKVRNAVTHKIPNIWIIGNNEKEEKSITWRRYCVKQQIKMEIAKATSALVKMRQERLMDNFEDVNIPE